MKSVKYTNDIYLRFGIHMVTKPPTLQYVHIPVNEHSCVLALFFTHVTYK
jgi:hypothetical protein